MSAALAALVGGLREGRRGELVQAKAERWVWRVEDGGRVLFAKCGAGAQRKALRREIENTRRLEALGLAADVVAAGELGGAVWLVCADAGPALCDVLAAEDVRVVLGETARAIRRLHDAGIGFRDFKAEHVRRRPGDVRLIDASRLDVRKGPLPPAARAADVGGLLASLDGPVLGRVGRLARARFLREALGGDDDAFRAACGIVDRQWLRRGGRTRWRRGFFVGTPSFAAALGTAAPLDRGAYGIVRTLPDRENRTLGRRADGRPLFHAKWFPPCADGPSPAMREAEAIERFLRAGIPVNRLAAHAEDLALGALCAVEACDGEPLDDVLRRGVAASDRRALAVLLGRLFGRMRSARLRHRDAYACHVFVTRTPGGWDARLIDLTRAGPAPFPRGRWYVKDAAALWHGCPRPPATRTDAVRWLRAYFGVPRLTDAAKRFARRVAAKERRIAARQARRARSA